MYKGKHNPRKSSEGSKGGSKTGRGFGGESKSGRPAGKSGFSKGDADDSFRSERKSYGDSEKKSYGDKPKSFSSDKGGFKKDSGERKSYGDRDSKPFGEKKSYGDRDSKPYGAKKSYGDRDSKPYGEKKSYGDRDSKPYGEKKSYGDRDSKPYSSDRGGFKKGFDGDKKPYDREKKSYGDRDAKPYGEKKSYGDRDSKPYSSDRGGFKKDFGGDKKPYDREKRSYGSDKPAFRKSYGDDEQHKEPKVKPTRTAYYDDGEEKVEFGEVPKAKKFTGKSPFKKKKANNEGGDDGSIRLNRYLASAGVGSRREADKLIESGAVKVNGKVVTEMGTKVFHNDRVEFGGERVKSEVLRYILLNKPKDYITTNDDPQNRKTVIDLVRGACNERVFPVGRLDRNTTGLLLITNDGDLAKKLTHPSYQIKKIYHVELDKNLTAKDMETIREGIKLEDGIIKVDEISYVEGAKSKKEIGVAIHSGKNRIVRRIFESLEHNVVKLDRVYFGGLTKKNLPKGRWRFLTELELSMLKML